MNLASRRYELILVVAGIIWGTSFAAGKIGVEHMDPVLFSALRYVFGAIAIFIALVAMKQLDLSVFRIKGLWVIALFNAVAMLFQNVGMTMTSATNTVLLVDINVVFIAILAVFVLKERLNRWMVMGLVIGLVGVVIISTNGDLSAIISGSFEGNMLVFGAGILWAFYVVLLTRELNGTELLASATGAVIIETAVFLIPVMLVLTKDYSIESTGTMAALFIGIFCTALAFILYSVGLKHLGATMASVILLVEIVFGILFAILLLGEMPTVATAIGGAMILLSVIVISMNQSEDVKSKRLAQE
ncbi:MAG TPA: DMT family transporter [Methanomassiliicoccales archaeon]